MAHSHSHKRAISKANGKEMYHLTSKRTREAFMLIMNAETSTFWS